ncbi:MAG: hypothetical protein OEU86_07885, partial [Gammaproteobacteria bacterium]|nr:hypothetical protein [Gammaproteobacteria bacterium]
RCRFFKWFHRNLNLKPEAPTVGYRRQYSRITAMEYIFITWFIYIVDLIMLDPRLIGPDRMVALSIVFLSYCGWCVYLTYKLTEQSGPAPTIRYAIGAGIVIWLIPETLAATQIIEEFYLKPFEFPILMSCITAYMVISFYALANATDRGALPKKKRDRKPPSQEAAPVEAQT